MDNKQKSAPLVASEENESTAMEPLEVQKADEGNSTANTKEQTTIKSNNQTRQGSVIVEGVRRELARFGSFVRELLARTRQKYSKLVTIKHRDTNKAKQEMVLENEDQFNETVTEKLIVSDESKEDDQKVMTAPEKA